MTALEILDTAVKIGLGSLITLIGSVAVTRLNHSHDSQKETDKRYFDSLEVAGANIDEITHIALTYWALVIEWVRNRELGKELTDYRKEELEKSKKDLFSAFKGLTIAESRLMLIGLKEQSGQVRSYGEYLKEFRRKHYDGRSNLKESEMENARIEILSHREKVYEALATAYKSGI